MADFILGENDSDSDGDDSLPFPKPLVRSVFLAPDFDPTTFLSGLSTRYQTLEDLRNELRDLSQSLNKELLDLVNTNYHDFLSLGSTLQGGEEKVEEVRVGLLSFQRDLITVKEKVDIRRKDVAELLDQKRILQQQINAGRRLLEIADRIEDLEGQLMIGQLNKHTPSRSGTSATKDVDDGLLVEITDGNDEADSEGDEDSSSLHKIERRVEHFHLINALIDRQGSTRPFLAQQEERLRRIRATLLLDLRGMLKQENSQQMAGYVHETGRERALRLYEALGAKADAEVVMRQSRKT